LILTYNETDKLCSWVAQNLSLLIWSPVNAAPDIFVTDNEAALTSALDKEFPNSGKLLCSWHIVRNFTRHNKKYFKTADDYEDHMAAVSHMIHSADMHCFEEALKEYRNAAAKSRNRKIVDEYLDK
jgi:MULE transposase domain